MAKAAEIPTRHKFAVDARHEVTRLNLRLRRYEQLVATAAEIGLTFLHGNTETEKRVAVFELVP